jgi:hypothetical protein
MLTLRDHLSRELFDPWEHLGAKRRRLLELSWTSVFREYLLVHLPVKELAVGFRDGHGRPSKDLSVALGALILQQLHDLTDQQATEAVALNIAWHYALDIRHESDACLCERTLRNYRTRLLEAGLDEVLFRTLTDKLIEKVGVDTRRQRLDSTTVKSAIRGLTRLGILVEATSKFLRELKRKNRSLYDNVDAEILRKYVEREGDGCFAVTRPSESKRRLPEAAQDVLALVEQFRDSEATKLEGYQLLQWIFHEQCEVVDDPDMPVVVRSPQNSGCDNVINPADPDARYNKHKGTGYLVQIMETFVEDDAASQNTSDAGQEDTQPPKPDLITHVAVDPLTMHDKDALEPALTDTEQRGQKPEELLADSHYGSMECLAQGDEHGVKIISPAQTVPGKRQGKLTLENFELNDEGRILSCPTGQQPLETSIADARLQVLFDVAVCRECPHRENCSASAASTRRSQRFQYTHDRVRQRERRLKNDSDEFRNRYRWRAGVEATMSRFKYQMGMAHLRIRGMRSVTLTALLRALGLNICRVAVWRQATARTR